jgi:hypothetical protein
MTLPARTALSLALPLCLLAGCAADTGAYPSLAPRPVERIEMTVPAAAGSPAETPPPATQPTNITAIVAAAQSAAVAFQAKLAEVRPAIEAGRAEAPGSEKWIVAQQAYSAADIARGAIGSALADLDHLHQLSIESGDAPQQASVEAAIQQVQALDDAARDSLMPLQPIGG